MRGEGDAAVRCCLRNSDVAALHHGRCRSIVLVDNLRMPAVIVDGNFLGILLEDEAARRFRCAAVEVRDAALGNIFAVRESARALVLVVLIVALVASFVDPLCGVLQVKIRCTAVVDKTMQVGVARCESDVQLARGERKEIAGELHVTRAGRISCCSCIHVDCALIRGEGIVAVLRPCRHLNGAAARNRDGAAGGIRRHSVAVDGQIHITVYGHLALFDLCQDAGVVEAREDVLTIEGNAPLIRFSTCNFEVAVDADRGADACLVGFLAEAVALLDSDAVAAKTARHGDVDRRVDRDGRCRILRCVELDAIRQRVAARKSLCEDVDFRSVDGDVLAVSCIDARRIANGVLCLKPERMSCGVYMNVIVRSIDAGEHICLFVACEGLAQADRRIGAVGDIGGQRNGDLARALPHGVGVFCGCCGEHDGGGRARHAIGCDRPYLVELIKCRI